MITEKLCKVLPVQTEKEVLKKLLILFAKDENVAPDLLRADFSVRKMEKTFICVIGEASTDFTCSVGYDRKENYVEIEKQKKSVKQSDGSYKWEYVEVPVNKTRTVTDWSPFSGSKSGKCFSFLCEDGKYTKECAELEGLVRDLQVEEMEETDESFTADEQFLQEGRRSLISEIEVRAQMGLPGDHHRDFRGSSSAEVLLLRRWLLPYYIISYSYKGKQYQLEIKGYKTDFSVELGEEQKEMLKYTPRDTKKEASDKYRLLSKSALVCGIAGAVGVAFSWVSFLGWLPLAFIPAIILTVLYFKKSGAYKKQLDEAEKIKKENILLEKHKVVYNALLEGLKKHGLEKLSFEEVYA